MCLDDCSLLNMKGYKIDGLDFSKLGKGLKIPRLSRDFEDSSIKTFIVSKGRLSH